MDVNDSASASNELTSTAEGVLTSDSDVKTQPHNECVLAGDSVPSSSSDANLQTTIEQSLQEDPISSTSDTNDLNVCQTTLELAEPSTADADFFSSDLNMDNISTEKIAEDYEDIAKDLENLLGEVTNDFSISIPRQKETVPLIASTTQKSVDKEIVLNENPCPSVKIPEEEVSNEIIETTEDGKQQQEKKTEIVIIAAIDTKEESNIDDQQPINDDKPTETQVDSSTSKSIPSTVDERKDTIEEATVIHETPTASKDLPNEEKIESTVVEDILKSEPEKSDSLSSEQEAIVAESTDNHHKVEDSIAENESHVQVEQPATSKELQTNDTDLIITQNNDEIKLQPPENMSEVSTRMEVDEIEESTEKLQDDPKVEDTSPEFAEIVQDLPQEAMETEELTEKVTPNNSNNAEDDKSTNLVVDDSSSVVVEEITTDQNPEVAIEETIDKPMKNEAEKTTNEEAEKATDAIEFEEIISENIVETNTQESDKNEEGMEQNQEQIIIDEVGKETETLEEECAVGAVGSASIPGNVEKVAEDFSTENVPDVQEITDVIPQEVTEESPAEEKAKTPDPEDNISETPSPPANEIIENIPVPQEESNIGPEVQLELRNISEVVPESDDKIQTDDAKETTDTSTTEIIPEVDQTLESPQETEEAAEDESMEQTTQDANETIHIQEEDMLQNKEDVVMQNVEVTDNLIEKPEELNVSIPNVVPEVNSAPEIIEEPHEAIVPKETAEAHEGTAEALEKTVEALEETSEDIEETAEALGEISAAREEATEALEETAEVPEETTEVPEETAEVPEEILKAPESTQEADAPVELEADDPVKLEKNEAAPKLEEPQEEPMQDIKETIEAEQSVHEVQESNLHPAYISPEKEPEKVENIADEEAQSALHDSGESSKTIEEIKTVETDLVVQEDIQDEPNGQEIQTRDECDQGAQETDAAVQCVQEPVQSVQESEESAQLILEDDVTTANESDVVMPAIAQEDSPYQSVPDTDENQQNMDDVPQSKQETSELVQSIQECDEAVEIAPEGETAQMEIEQAISVLTETDLAIQSIQGDEVAIEEATEAVQSIQEDPVVIEESTEAIQSIQEDPVAIEESAEAVQSIQEDPVAIEESTEAVQRIQADSVAIEESTEAIQSIQEDPIAIEESAEAVQSIQEDPVAIEESTEAVQRIQADSVAIEESIEAIQSIQEDPVAIEESTEAVQRIQADSVAIEESTEAIQSIQEDPIAIEESAEAVQSIQEDPVAIEESTEAVQRIQADSVAIEESIEAIQSIQEDPVAIEESTEAIQSIQEDEVAIETDEAIQSIQEINENLSDVVPIATEIQSAVESIQGIDEPEPDTTEMDLAVQIIQQTNEAIHSIQGADEELDQEASQSIPEIDQAIQSIQGTDVDISSIREELNEDIETAMPVGQADTIQADNIQEDHQQEEMMAVQQIEELTAPVDDETVEAVQSIQQAFGFETPGDVSGDNNFPLQQPNEYNEQEIPPEVETVDDDATKQAINSIQLIENDPPSEDVPVKSAEIKLGNEETIKTDLVTIEQPNEEIVDGPSDVIKKSAGKAISEDIAKSKTEGPKKNVNDDLTTIVDSSVSSIPNVRCLDEGNIAALAIQEEARDAYTEDEVMSTQELPKQKTCQRGKDRSAVEDEKVTSTEDTNSVSAIPAEMAESSDENVEPQEPCKSVGTPLVIDIDSSEETAAVPEVSTSQYSSKMSEKESLKMTITKHRVDSPRDDDSHSILKIYDPKEDGKRERSKGKDATVPKLIIKPVVRSQASPTVDEFEQAIPKLFIRNMSKESPNRPGSPKVSKIQKSELTSPLKLTIKPVLKPDENQCKSSPKLTIKPIVKPDDESSSFTPKITIKPIVKPDDEPVHSPKITIKPIIKPEEGANDTMHSPRITIKAIPKPEEVEGTHSPKITIKPLVRPEDKDEDRSHSPRVTIKPVVKPEDAEPVHSPRITIKPIVKPHDDDEPTPKLTIKPLLKTHEEERRDKKEGSPKIKIKPLVKPPEMDCELVDFEDQIKQERIVLKINKNASSTKEGRKREATEEIEKLAKIKLKFSKEGGHAHIISDQAKLKRNQEDSAESESKRIRIETVDLSSSPENSRDVIEIKDDSSAPLDDPMEGIPVFEITQATTPTSRIPVTTPSSTPQQPRKRGRPRKVPLVVREEFKDVREEGSPQPVAQVVREGTGRPKRSCRGPSVCTTLGIKPRKPRGGGAAAAAAAAAATAAASGTSVSPTATTSATPTRGRGRGRGSRGGSRGGRQQKLSAAKVKLLQEEAAAAVAIAAAGAPPPPVEAEEIRTPEPDAIIEILDDDTKEEETPPQPQPLPQTEFADIKAGPDLTPPTIDSVTCESSSDVVLIEEETRMSADISNSRAPTPAKQVLNAGEIIEDTQSSVQSTATSESVKVKKASRLEVHQEPEVDIVSPDQLAEYYWAGGGPYMLQEQVAQFLGIKSFKRKYPGIQRRPVDMQERDFIRESGLASEAMCDMGLTAVNSADILDIMYSDFQHKYEEYCKHQRDRQAKDVINKQRALSLAASQEKNKQDLTQSAVQSAASWNSTFNRTRREERRACMDLQTFTVNYPKGRFRALDKAKVGSYPVALVPGQFTDHYKTYSPNELYNLPLNTMMNKAIPIQSNDDSQSDGSESESDSSSSDSDSSSSDSSDEDCHICSPPSSGAKKMVAS